RRRRLAEGEGLGPIALGDPPHRRRGLAQRLVPGDRLPAGIAIALGPRAPQRLRQTFGMIDELGRGASLGAQGLSRRMRWIGLEPRETPVLDDRNAAAAGDAEAAIALDTLDAGRVGQGVVSRFERTTGYRNLRAMSQTEPWSRRREMAHSRRRATT